MTIDDYEDAFLLWSETNGIELSESDSKEAIGNYLRLNPGMSMIARSLDGRLLGAVLCGHDGRRGYLYHLAVVRESRRRGIASALVSKCLSCLYKQNLNSCNIFVFDTNKTGIKFWINRGWRPRDGLVIMQKKICTESLE